jgi:hypothetical protein
MTTTAFNNLLSESRIPVAAVLTQSGRQWEAANLDRCFHNIAKTRKRSTYCHSRFCLSCHKLKDQKKYSAGLHAALYRAQTVQSAAHRDRLLFVTLPLSNCYPQELRHYASAAITSVRRLTTHRDLRAAEGWYAFLEVAVANEPDQDNVHIHAVFDVRGFSGSRYVSRQRWTDLWVEAAGPHAREVDVGDVRDIQATARYITARDKYIGYAELATSDPARFIRRADALHNLRGMYMSAGTLASAGTLQVN